MRRYVFVIILIAFCGLTACVRRWHDAEAFRTSLSCGMTYRQLIRLANAHHAQVSQAAMPEMGFDIVTVKKGNTTFWLYLSDRGLQKVRRGDYSVMTRVELGPTQYLCVPAAALGGVRNRIPESRATTGDE